VSGAAAGSAEVDEVKAATTARTTAEETRITESCCMIKDDSRRTAGFYVLKMLLYEIQLAWSYCQQRGISAMPADCQPRSISYLMRGALL
jgi:hypothetical protein